MKILVVSATALEITPLLTSMNISAGGSFRFHSHTDGPLHLDFLVTGIGMMHCTFHLGEALARGSYDLVIQAGVAGSFDPAMPLGTVVNVTEERCGDLGAEDGDQFLDLTDLDLWDEEQFPYRSGTLCNPGSVPVSYINQLPQVRGISVNTVHGHAPHIERIILKYRPQVENMEGAAVFYTCLNRSQPFYELRAISNYVEPRNKENWELALAVNNLNNSLLALFSQLKE